MITGLHYLRAIAAMLVVGHHANSYFLDHGQWSNFGEAGVDIFFVISGFVMAWTTQRNATAPSPAHAAFMFLARRLIRVVPLYWLALLWLLKRDIWENVVDPQTLLDFLFLPRFNPDHLNHIYPVLVPGWTINYEMFFYAIFAASILLGRYKYVAIFSTLTATILVGHWVDFQSAFGQFYTSSIVAEFLYGILICKLVQKFGHNHFPRLAGLALCAAFAGLAFVSPGDIPRAYFAGPIAALIVYAGILAFNGRNLPWLHRLADASFSIYLTHLFTFKISRSLLMHALPPDQASPAAIALGLGVQMAIAAIVGLMVHRWVEQPLTQYLTRRFIKPRESLLPGRESPTQGV